MVIHAMEERRWQHGMRMYLKENQYEVTDGEIYFVFMQRALDDLEATDKVGYRGSNIIVLVRFTCIFRNNIFSRNGISHMDSIKHLTAGIDRWDTQ